MCSSLTDQVRSIAKVTTAVARGDLTQKITGVSVQGQILDLVNTMVIRLWALATEVSYAGSQKSK